MILKEELHACPWCWFFTLKKWVFSCCEICDYRPNQFSEYFPVESYYFEYHRNKKTLYEIQQESIEGLPLKWNEFKISKKYTWDRELNIPVLHCLNDGQYWENKVYEFYTRHPFWRPLESNQNLNIKELYEWYKETLKESSLSELNKNWYISISVTDLEKTIVLEEEWALHMCPWCWFESISWGLFWYDICDICFWEDDCYSVLYPTESGWPNHESLIEVQECIIKYIPIETKEYHWFKRNKFWKTINIEEIKDKEKPFIEKWFYNEYMWEYKKYHKEDFKEAQKFNPTKY